MKQYTLLSVLGLSTLLAACGDHPSDVSQPNIIIGDNDLQYYTKDDQISNAIGRIALGCTATHIGNGFVLTAGHCVSDNVCSSSSYNITWGYTENNRKGKLVSRCQEVVARENNNLRDYAILRYSPVPASSLPINMKNRPRRGDRLTIFSHPNGIPLAWSGYCAHDGNFSGQKFSYTCDTMGGSSGAAILNGNLEIVGIHNLGSSYQQVNAGTYLMDISALK
ncbi:MAG: trypsin-like serine peptidase [Oligoflexus sp.]